MKKFLITILAVIVIAVGAFCIWLATLDGSYDVKRSITVNKANGEVFGLVKDFNQWTSWSPWLCMEPDAKVDVTGNGASVGDSYAWEGELVGSGIMKHENINEGKTIDQSIHFLKPYESKSNVYWEFNNVNDSVTEVTWGMKGEMPFMMRFMAKMMDPMIGMDFERGLKMIKDLAEKGYVASKIEIIGIVDAPSVSYIGEKTSCTMDEVSNTMKASITKLTTYAAEKSLSYDKIFSIYHTFDFVEKNCEYTTALPIQDSLAVEAPFYTGKIPVSKALKIKFTGDYEHISNAWAAGMSYLQTHKVKENDKIAPYEVYLTSPELEPDERKWISEVYIPIK